MSTVQMQDQIRGAIEDAAAGASDWSQVVIDAVSAVRAAAIDLHRDDSAEALSQVVRRLEFYREVSR